MKKKFFFGVALMATAAGVFGFRVSSQPSDAALTPLQMKNLEALSRGEGGDRIPCHSSAKENYNAAYVDCSSCHRIENWEGKGTEARCTN